MIIVHGKSETQDSFGPVESLNCKICRISNEWNVIKKTEWYSLYFIPIIPFSRYSICCNKCNHEEVIQKKEYQIYYGMLEVSQSIIDGKPSISQLESIHKLTGNLKTLNDKKIKKLNEEKQNFLKLVNKMSNEELLERVNKRDGFSAAFLSVVDDEIKLREI